MSAWTVKSESDIDRVWVRTVDGEEVEHRYEFFDGPETSAPDVQVGRPTRRVNRSLLVAGGIAVALVADTVIHLVR